MSKKKKNNKNYKLYSEDQRLHMVLSYLRDEISVEDYDDFLHTSFETFGTEDTMNIYNTAVKIWKEVLDDAKK